jgi:hypothetical protein
MLMLSAALQAPATPPAPPPDAPPAADAQTPADQAPVDPATSIFATNVGLLLVAVKAESTADYEAAITALQSAFAASTDATRRAIAQGWRVYKAGEADAKGNALYVHALLPAMPGIDYRPSLWLDQLIAEAPADLIAKYQASLAGAPSRLSLTELAHMAVAPVAKPAPR